SDYGFSYANGYFFLTNHSTENTVYMFQYTKGLEGDSKNNIGEPDTISFSPKVGETFVKWYKKQNAGPWVEYNTTDTLLIENYDTVSQWHYMVEYIADTETDTTSIFTVQSKYAQTLSFAPLAEMAMTDDDQSPNVTANSDSAITFSSSNENIATIIDGKVHPVGVGTCTITAIAQENDWYWPSEEKTQEVTIKSQGQTIAFTLKDTAYVGDADIAPEATASSALTVSYSSSDSSIATIVDNKIQLVSEGRCQIFADQAGNGTYAASQTAQDITVLTNAPSITNLFPTENDTLLINSVYITKAIIKTDDPADIDTAIAFWGTSPEELTLSTGLIQLEDTFYTPLSMSVAGTYYGQIVAYGANGKNDTTEVVELTFISTAPVIVKTYPSQDTVYTKGDSIFLAVQTTVPSGTIDQVFLLVSADGVEALDGLELESIAPDLYGLKAEAGDMPDIYIRYVVIANNDTTMTDYTLLASVCEPIDNADALAASDISAEGFTAHWTASPDAESYLLDVWTGSGQGIDYIQQGASVSDTFLVVPELVSGRTYYYSVKAVGNYGCISDDSNTIEITTAIVTELQEQAIMAEVRTGINTIKVMTETATDVNIYHISGLRIASDIVQSPTAFEVKSGIYLVELNNKVHKVVVP
nr:fibronectin type III domain-containing protein [Bacteroidales bacterium]